MTLKVWPFVQQYYSYFRIKGRDQAIYCFVLQLHTHTSRRNAFFQKQEEEGMNIGSAPLTDFLCVRVIFQIELMELERRR